MTKPAGNPKVLPTWPRVSHAAGSVACATAVGINGR